MSTDKLKIAATALLGGREPIAGFDVTDSRTGEALFHVRWSEKDGEYVGTCPRYPSLSHLDPNSTEALAGIAVLVRDVERDLAHKAKGSS